MATIALANVLRQPKFGNRFACQVFPLDKMTLFALVPRSWTGSRWKWCGSIAVSAKLQTPPVGISEHRISRSSWSAFSGARHVSAVPSLNRAQTVSAVFLVKNLLKISSKSAEPASMHAQGPVEGSTVGEDKNARVGRGIFEYRSFVPPLSSHTPQQGPPRAPQ